MVIHMPCTRFVDRKIHAARPAENFRQAGHEGVQLEHRESLGGKGFHERSATFLRWRDKTQCVRLKP
jgi:hypothetical protein